MPSHKQPLLWLAIILLFSGIACLSYVAHQQQFVGILLFYSMAFGGYALMTSQYHFSITSLLTYSTLLSLVTIFSWPTLSDDIYRFMWDGRLVNHGINPYAFLPDEMMDTPLKEQLAHWYPRLNSPKYYSVYPAVCQVFFAISDAGGKLGIPFHVVLKLLYLIIHLIGAYYAYLWMKSEKMDTTGLKFYYLNPLVIVEGIGNLHAEVVMVALFLMGLYYFSLRRWWQAALLISLAIATKMTVLMLLPFLFLYAIWQKQWTFIQLTTVFNLLLFLPVLWARASGFASSLDLYFRKFEFNAGLYYLLRWLGSQVTGYNLIAYIGPLLALMALISIVMISFKIYPMVGSINTMVTAITMMLTIHLLCSTTIHPWYLITLICFASLSNTKAILLWSYTITWSYIHYNNGRLVENYTVILLEYAFVLWTAYFLNDYIRWRSILQRHRCL